MDHLGSAIGRSIPRIDGRPKVTGRARFAADIPTAGLLHGRPVLAIPAHARIERIDVAEALAVPGVIAVLTAADLPIVTEGTDRIHEPLARSEILWAGQPVALVVAETPEAAADAATLVVVETTPLEAVVDLERAFAPGAARARLDRVAEEATASEGSQHAAVGGGAEEFTPDEPVSDNVVARTGYRRGDVAAALAGSDVVVEGTFTTSWVHQGYLEPQVAMAELDGDGILHVTSATQGIFYTRSELARLFGRSMADVRVTGATLGGGFGGKVMIADPLAAAATLILGRPVRVELTRLEDFRMANPAPAAILEVSLGATNDGRLRGLRARLRFETGGFSENSIEGIAAILTIGPYHWDAHEVAAYGVETNRFGTGAYRAPGATQATFALEQLIDELAGRLGMDPIELRRRNLVAPDDEMADGTAVGRDRPGRVPGPARGPPALSRPGVAPGRRGGRAGGRRVARRTPARVGRLQARARRPGHGRDRRVAALGRDREGDPWPHLRRVDGDLLVADDERDGRHDPFGRRGCRRGLRGRDDRLGDLGCQRGIDLGGRLESGDLGDHRLGERGRVHGLPLVARHDGEGEGRGVRGDRGLDRAGLERRRDGRDPVGEPRRIEPQPRCDRDPVERRPGVGDRAIDGGPVAADRERLVHEGVRVETAADLVVGDDRRAIRAGQDDAAVRVAVIGGVERGVGIVRRHPGQVHAPDLDAGQDASRVLLVVGIQGAGAEAQGQDHANEEGDPEPKPRRGTTRVAGLAGLSDGVAGERHVGGTS